MKQSTKRWMLNSLGVAAIVLMMGCGGGGGSSVASRQGGGVLTLSIRWPARVAGTIPTKTEAIRIVLRDQSEQVIGTPRVVTRPSNPTPGQPARVLFNDLPPGPVFVEVSAHGTPGATDPPLSLGNAGGTVVPGQRTVVMVEMFSTVATIEVTPAQTTLNVGQPQTFTAVAKDGQGQTLTGVSFDWMSFDPTIVAVDPKTGVATGVNPGNASIFVQEEAGIYGDAGGGPSSPGLRASGQADVSVAGGQPLP